MGKGNNLFDLHCIVFCCTTAYHQISIIILPGQRKPLWSRFPAASCPCAWPRSLCCRHDGACRTGEPVSVELRKTPIRISIFYQCLGLYPLLWSPMTLRAEPTVGAGLLLYLKVPTLLIDGDDELVDVWDELIALSLPQAISTLFQQLHQDILYGREGQIKHCCRTVSTRRWSGYGWHTHQGFISKLLWRLVQKY